MQPVLISLILTFLMACGQKAPKSPSQLAEIQIGSLEGMDYDWVRLTVNSELEFEFRQKETIEKRIPAGRTSLVLDYFKGQDIVFSNRFCRDEIRDEWFDLVPGKNEVTISVCSKDHQTEIKVEPDPEDEEADVIIKPKPGDDDPLALTCGANPYQGFAMTLNPRYTDQVRNQSLPKVRGTPLESTVQRLTQTSTAVWIDRIDSIKKIAPALNEAEKAKQNGQTPITTFVVYNLPVRDCAAYASAGELGPQDMNRYKHEFIDPIRAAFQDAGKRGLPISVVLEVDSLPNLVTNLDKARCNQAAPLYKEGIAYAIKKLSLPNVSIYLDVAHSGWVGWETNRKGIAKLYKEVIDLGGGPDKIRGFATNVSNYTPLSRPGADRTNDYFQYNDAVDELTLVKLLMQNFKEVGLDKKGFIIDTSRNGALYPRDDWGEWCNVKGAALGRFPTINPRPSDGQCVDAYLWIKPPGESDGTTEQQSSRYDQMCDLGFYGANDPDRGNRRAPEAGAWFHDHLMEMIKNSMP